MIRLYVFLTTFFFSFANYAFTQNRWESITVMTKSNDTIKGEILIKPLFKSYTSISVKNTTTKEIKVFQPSEVSSFTVKTDDQVIYFKTLKIQADYSPNEIPLLDDTPAITFKTDIVFAQLLIQGDKNLYYFKDGTVYKGHLLIETQNAEAIELVNKRYYVDAAKTLINYNEEYKNQLIKLFSPSSSVNAKRIHITDYSVSNIKSLVKDYNFTMDKDIHYEYKEERIKVCWGVLIGFNNTSLKFKKDKELGALKFNNSKGINAGIKMDVIIPKTLKKWSICNELMFSNFKFISQNYYSTYINKNNYDKVNYKFEAYYLRLASSFRFRFAYRFSPFVNFGVVNSLAVYQSSTINTQHIIHSESSYSTTPFRPYKKHEQAFLIGGGVEYKKWGLELRYERGTGMSGYLIISSPMNYIFALLHYSL